MWRGCCPGGTGSRDAEGSNFTCWSPSAWPMELFSDWMCLIAHPIDGNGRERERKRNLMTVPCRDETPQKRSERRWHFIPHHLIGFREGYGSCHTAKWSRGENHVPGLFSARHHPVNIMHYWWDEIFSLVSFKADNLPCKLNAWCLMPCMVNAFSRSSMP